MPVNAGGVGLEGVREFYSQKFIPQVPGSLEVTLISRTFGSDRIVEESLISFVHNVRMDWFLPGLEPTGQKICVVMIGIIEFEGNKIAAERLYWDHAAVLVQLGLIDQQVLALPGSEANQAVLDLTRNLRQVAASTDSAALN